MKLSKFRLSLAICLAALLLIAGAAWARGMLAPQAYAPSPEALSQSFSLHSGDPLTAAGRRPADLLTLSGAVLIPCEELGLLCVDPVTGAVDDLNAVSFGGDFLPSETLVSGAGDRLVVEFSVGRGSQGLPNTAVRKEATCASPEAHGDVFATTLISLPLQVLDGDGAACSTNSGYSLAITEGASSDNVEALERDPCRTVDLDCNSQRPDLVFFSLAPGSPSLAYLGVTSADILVAGIDYAPVVYAYGAADLSLRSGDAIDALCLGDNGDGFFGADDRLLFSLAPGSPTLAARNFSAAALLRPYGKAGLSPLALGLLNSDDVDAALCAGDLRFADMYLPVISKLP